MSLLLPLLLSPLLSTGGTLEARTVPPTAPLSHYQVIHLDGLVPGTFGASALNDAGEVTGLIFADGALPARAFVWRAGALLTEALPGPLNVADINEDGVVVGSAGGAATCTAFTWDSRTGQIRAHPSALELFPSRINEDLRIVGGDCSGLLGFALDGKTGGVQVLGFGPPPAQGVGTLGASGVNTNGRVVGSEVVFDQAKGYYEELPYLWTDKTGTVPLPVLANGFGGRAVDINDKGEIGGYVNDDVSGKQTALWTSGGSQLTNLGSPAGFFVSEVTAINDDGHLAVVAPNDWFGFTRAFVWDGARFVDLSDHTAATGLFALRPLDINDRGEVLVQLGDEQGQVIRDIVILRPLPTAPGGRGVPTYPKQQQ